MLVAFSVELERVVHLSSMETLVGLVQQHVPLTALGVEEVGLEQLEVLPVATLAEGVELATTSPALASVSL